MAPYMYMSKQKKRHVRKKSKFLPNTSRADPEKTYKKRGLQQKT